jgi:peroxiredoxin
VDDGSPERSQTAPAQQAGDNGEPADVQPTEPKPPPPKPTIPEVKLSEQDDAMCMVRVGDLLPEGTLADTEGEQHELQSLRGEKLTVVCFWKAELAQALEELRQLGMHVVEPYAEKGVRVVGINVGDSPDVAREKLRPTEAKFTNLLDPDGEYFHKVASEKLPRTQHPPRPVAGDPGGTE